MADNRIDLVARLNVADSANEINQTDIPDLQRQIKKIEIKCSLDTNGISALKNQLGNFAQSQQAKINIATEIKKGDLDKQAKEFEKSLNLSYPRGKTDELRDELKKLLSDYQKAYDIEGGLGQKTQDNMVELIRFANSYREEISLINEELKDTQDRIKNIKREQQQVFITTDQYNALDKYARNNKSTAKAMLDSALGATRWSADINTYKHKNMYYWSNFAEEVNQINPFRDAIVNENDIIQGINDLSEFMSKTFSYIDDSLDKNGQAYQDWGMTVIETINSITGKNIFSEQELEFDDSEVRYAEELSETYKEAAEQSNSLHMQQELLQQSYEKLAEKIRKAKLNIDEVGTREEYLTGEIVNYNKEFNEIMGKKIVDVSELNKAANLYKAINNEFGILNAQMSSEIPQNAIENLAQRIAKLDSQIKLVNLDFENLTLVPDDLKANFDKLNNLAENFDFSPDYQIESKEALNERVKSYTQIRVALNETKSLLQVAQKKESDLQKEESKFLSKLDAHNKEIQKRLDLKEKELEKARELSKTENEKTMGKYWQGRFEETIKAQTAENQVLKDMKKYYEELEKANNKANKASQQEENRTINLSNRIKRLTADVTSYASANQRAVNSLKQMTSGSTFAAEWSRISAEMAKGTELTDRELKILAADMAVFKKEAKAAGLEGESTWSKFLSSFKTMSSYITANMVFNFAKRQIRDMVNEVTAIDTAMTELHKVTEATEDQFEAFAVSAGKTGRELGASVSDVINATSTFSRAGFNLPDAEELGRVATLYKNVGDGITIDSASESIISIMKAFNIEASDSERIIDRINKVSNNFAVDSGGLGESLKRVASAMASANNTLDETIALTTVANEIVQDPVAVAQAWRTVSMRIRGAKAELEQAGEDTEGMVESTAKLQGLIKGMTGIDIMVDENTFKSTYEIIKELGAVWNDLQDIEQAQVLEAIAGKRQANVVASALRNYERLDDVLQTSIDSQGSARAEQEEYAKSIQYSIDTLKAAYQDFADSVINSDFVKELLGTAQTFLEILTKIIDEFGTLPTILTSIAAVGGLKNIGLFGNLENGLTGVTNKFQSLKQVMLYDFGSLYKKFNINLGGISDSEVQSLQNYVDALKLGVKPAEAMKDIMSETSEAAQQQATQFTYLYQASQRGEISANQYRVATQNLALTQRTAAATSKALSIALNTLANIGIMIAINLAIKGISALVDKLIVTKEELAEIRQETLQDLDDLASGIEEVTKKEGEVQSLIEQYHKLVLSTNDLSDNKDELLEIQNSLIEQYGAEKDSLDLLNDSYDTTIEKINALSDAEYAEFERKNSAKIEELEKIRSYNVGWVNEDENGRLSEQVEGANQVYLKGWVDNTDSLAASLYKIEDVSEDIENIWQNIEGIDFDDGWFKNTLYLSGDIYDAYAQLGNLIDAIRASDIDNKAEALAPIEARYKELGQYIQDIDQYLQRKNAHEAEYIETIGQVSLNTLASLKEINAAVGDARASWFENLKDIESGFGKNLDSMTTALQNLSDGKSLSRSDFWNLMELDTNKILTDIKMVGDGFVLNQEQLIKFKDEYIKQQVESLKLDNQNLVTKQEDLKVTLEQAKAELSILGARGMSNAAYREQYQKAYESIKQGEKNLADYGEQIKRNNILIDQWNAKLGDTTDKTKQLQEQQKKLTDEVSKLNEELDNYQKAYEYVIDNIIDGLNDELDVLNEQKQTLQDELDALNEQKDAIEDIIDNYDTVNKLVQDTVEKRKEELEAEKKSIEDSYNERINKLKEENEEREDAFEYAQKLANLENARNNKRRVLDETRGWRYESVKEDVVKAENDLASFENEQAVKALEKERDEQVKRIDDIIKSETEYSELWKEISEEIQTEEQELLAEQILGADWREKIANHDIEIISKFRTEYRAHNVELQRITGTEIKLKQAAIEAKDAEIKAKQAQIKEWQNYKKEVQDAVKDIKNAQEDYMRLVGDIQLNENSSLTDRANNFETFKNRVTGYINDIAEKQSALEGVNAELDRLKENGDINISIEGLDDIRTFVEGIGTVSEKMAEYIEKMGEMPTINSPGDAKYWQAAGYKQYSAPQKLTAPTPKIYSAPPPITNSSTSNTNSSLSIGAINVYANNPTELSRGLDKELDKYFRTKLTQSYTQK